MSSIEGGKPWKNQKRAWHKVTPPSGMDAMELRLPGLTELVRDEAVPERLRAIALKAAAHPQGLKGVLATKLGESEKKEETDEQVLADDEQSAGLKSAIDDVVEIQKRLIVKNVKVGGEFLTLEDLNDPDFPAPDAEWLAGVMLREIGTDAKGVTLGIAPLDDWALFRHFHDCGPGCGACAALQDELSTVDLGVSSL